MQESRSIPGILTMEANSVRFLIATIATVWLLLSGGVAAQNLDESPPLPEGAAMRLGSTHFRHANRVTAVDFSPDGKLLVTGAASPAISVWDVSTGLEVFRIRGFPIPYDVRFHPDGKSIAAATPLGVRLFEVPAGRPLRRMEGPAPEDKRGLQGKNAIAFADDGRVIFWANGRSKKIRAWDVSSGREIAAMDWPHGSGFASIAVAADGKRLAASGRLGLWGWPPSGEGIRRKYGDESISSLAFAPDGVSLALGGWRGTLRIVDPSDGAVIRDWKAHVKSIWSVAWAPDGSHIATSGVDDILRIWTRGGEKVLESGETRISNPPARAIDYAPDGRSIAVANGNAIRIWDLAEGRPRDADSGHLTGVTAIAFSPNGKQAATGGHDGTVRLWDVGTGREEAIIPCPRVVIRSLSFSPDGRRLVAAGPDNMSHGGALWVWDLAKGEEVHTWRNEKEKFQEAQFLRRGNRVVARVGRRKFQTFDLDSREAIGSFIIPYVPGGEPLISPDGRYAACHTGNHTEGSTFTELFDLETGRVMVRLGHAHQPRKPLQSLAFSPDARVFITARGGDVRLWETLTGLEIRSLPDSAGMAGKAALSPDGHTIAVTRSSGLVLYDLDADEIRRTIPLHTGVGALAFSPDGRLLAATLYDTTVLLWRVKESEAAGAADRKGDPAEEMRLSWEALANPDARSAYSAIADLTARRDAAVAFLTGEHARHLKADPKEVRGLIRDLAALEFETRETADAALRGLGDKAEEEIRAALAAGPDPEVKLRLGKIVEILEDPIIPGGRPALRWIRAIQVLERIGTEDAQHVLAKLARDCPHRLARATASEALSRLHSRNDAEQGG